MSTIFQAKAWDCKRHVVLVVIFSERELFPRRYWFITSLARYRARGKSENKFGELKGALRAQLPSSPRPKQHYAGKTIDRSDAPVRKEDRPQNEALLVLALLEYQTMHQGRCALESASGKGWSLCTFLERVLSAGCLVARHARCMNFHIAQSVASCWSILLAPLKKSTMQNAWPTRLVRVRLPRTPKPAAPSPGYVRRY